MEHNIILRTYMLFISKMFSFDSQQQPCDMIFCNCVVYGIESGIRFVYSIKLKKLDDRKLDSTLIDDPFFNRKNESK